MAFFPLLIFLLFSCLYSTGSSFVVETKYGKLESTRAQSENSKISCPAFLGVPFAKPPVGQLRFAKPEPPEPWTEVIAATTQAPQCQQIWNGYGVAENPRGGSEDCLYLNIVMPEAERVEPGKYPVMVWIHGGAFLFGDSYSYDPGEICRNLIQHGVIVVTIQYRLGFLGFFSTGDERARGNWGIHDQIAALKWVHENIKNFGGDPNRVTIFGESAGGVSVSLLSYIKEADSYFQQAIPQSGTPFAYWGLNDRALDSSRQFLKAAGCDKEQDKVNCMRLISWEKLDKIHLGEFGAASMAPTAKKGEKFEGRGHGAFEAISFLWAPIVDGDLVTGDLEAMAKQCKSKPYIMGTTSSEAQFYFRPTAMLEFFKIIEKENNLPTKPWFIEEDDQLSLETVLQEIRVAVSLYRNPRSGDALFNPQEDKLLERVTKHTYFDQHGSTNNKTYLVSQTLKLLSDIWVNYAVLLDAQTKKNTGSKVWFYSFDRYKDASFPADFPHKGAPHCVDVEFLFTRIGSLLDTPFNDDDKKIQGKMTKMWTDFAKNGQPADADTWPEFVSKENPVHLKINKAIEISSDFHKETIELWTSLLPKIMEAQEAQRHEEL